MRYIVLSDIHSNAPALEAVLQDAPAHDAVICLGDIVGYGPNPNLCVERIRELGATSLAGNHDLGAVGKADLRVFNHDARSAILWTKEALTQANQRYLQDLSAMLRLTDQILLVHGSPRDPIWEYLVDTSAGTRAFREYEFELLMVGHSHLPILMEWGEDQQAHPLRADVGSKVNLNGRRLIVNPGSVGQPRDGNPKAAYGILDTDTMTWVFRRVSYPIEITQERMRAQGLPRRLIDRLELGR